MREFRIPHMKITNNKGQVFENVEDAVTHFCKEIREQDSNHTCADCKVSCPLHQSHFTDGRVRCSSSYAINNSTEVIHIMGYTMMWDDEDVDRK